MGDRRGMRIDGRAARVRFARAATPEAMSGWLGTWASDADSLAWVGAVPKWERMGVKAVAAPAHGVGGVWIFASYGPGERVVLPSLELELPVDAIYAGWAELQAVERAAEPR